jgi:hypothetical protein
MSALSAVCTAIYTVLHGDSTMAALTAPSILDGSAGVFGDVPANQSYPHVEISDGHTEKPWNTIGGANVNVGYQDLVTVHIWSRYQGDLECYNILNRVNALLNFQPITVSGFSTVICEYDGGRILREEVNKIETRHLPARYKVSVR